MLTVYLLASKKTARLNQNYKDYIFIVDRYYAFIVDIFLELRKTNVNQQYLFTYFLRRQTTLNNKCIQLVENLRSKIKFRSIKLIYSCSV